MQRDIHALAETPFDLLVVGGGILGASIARDAALRGLTVALVERGDWASGTSSNSLRIVHGGLRYLQHLDLRRMRESIRERSYWLRAAPHLITPLPVLVPTYGRGLRGKALLRAALAANDIVSWDRNRGLHPDRHLPPGRSVSLSECLALAPQLSARNLTGGVLFHDAQMYSSERLVLETVLGASMAGATVANYLEVVAPLRRDGRLEGVYARDGVGGAESIAIRARAIVNAAGPAACGLTSTLLEMPSSSRQMEYTIALNIGVPSTGHTVAFALSGSSSDPNAVLRRGARQLFVVPWRERTLIGTAHLPFRGDPASFRVTDDLIETFLGDVNRAWPGREWRPEDLRIVHGGLLPGRADPTSHAVRLDKRHRITDDTTPGGAVLVTVTSVKFTTARLVAEQAVDRVCARLSRPVRCRTLHTPLPGALDRPVAESIDFVRRERPEVSPAVIEHLIRTYGSRYPEVLSAVPRDRAREWLTPVDALSPTTFAQMAFGARAEMAVVPEDLVWRRTELGWMGDDLAAAHTSAVKALALTASVRHLRSRTPVRAVGP